MYWEGKVTGPRAAPLKMTSSGGSGTPEFVPPARHPQVVIENPMSASWSKIPALSPRSKIPEFVLRARHLRDPKSWSKIPWKGFGL